MKKNILILLSIFMIFIYCGKKVDKHDHDHKHGEEGHVHSAEESAHSNQLSDAEAATIKELTDQESHGKPTTVSIHDHLHISPEIIKNWKMTYTKPLKRKYLEKIDLTGVIKENKNRNYLINTMVPGRVTSILKDIGNPVRKGDILCIINSPEILTKKTSFIKAMQQFKMAKENFNRAQKLHKIKGLETKELVSRETIYKTAMAEYFSLEAELLSLGIKKSTIAQAIQSLKKGDTGGVKGFISPYLKILSPAPGKVIHRNLSLGEIIASDRTLFEISDTGNLWVLFDVFPKDLKFIDGGKDFTLYSGVYPTKVFYGKISAIMEKLDPEIRTVKVRGIVDNSSGLLKPEMYIKGAIKTTLGQKLLSLPHKAIVTVSGIKGVFLKEADGFLFTPVEVIDTDSDNNTFIRGIDINDTVVTEGSFYLKAEYMINKGKGTDPHAGHNHG